MAGENADANIEKAEDFIVNVLPGLIEGYAAEDIYNADETGIVFKCLPDKTYGFSKVKCHGGKKSKDRLTVIVFNMTGKIQKPRCFKNVNSLLLQYFANKKAWMTWVLFETWLLTLDARFKAENKKVPN
jgi:hypothetical protein